MPVSQWNQGFLDHSPSPALRPCRLTIPHQGVLQALRHAAAARDRSHGGSEGQRLGGRFFFVENSENMMLVWFFLVSRPKFRFLLDGFRWPSFTTFCTLEKLRGPVTCFCEKSSMEALWGMMSTLRLRWDFVCIGLCGGCTSGVFWLGAWEWLGWLTWMGAHIAIMLDTLNQWQHGIWWPTDSRKISRLQLQPCTLGFTAGASRPESPSLSLSDFLPF